ncbi:MAG: hypothetical protein WB630_22190 [Candidatus Acidiferrales bacterium]
MNARTRLVNSAEELVLATKDKEAKHIKAASKRAKKTFFPLISKVRCKVWLTMAVAVGLGTMLLLNPRTLIYASGAS